MQNTLFQAICRMGIFMICAQAVIHFRAKESYEKYLKLLVSVMVLIQVFLPLGKFFLGDGRQQALNALGQLGLDLEQSMRQANEDAAAADEVLEKMTLEEVRKRLEEQEEEQGGGTDGEQRAEERQEGQTEENRAKAASEIRLDEVEPVVIDPVEPIRQGAGEGR